MASTVGGFTVSVALGAEIGVSGSAAVVAVKKAAAGTVTWGEAGAAHATRTSNKMRQ